MKLTDCEKMAEEFVRGKRGNKAIKITGIKNKDINTVEVKGYCEDTRFTVDVDKNQSEIIAYDLSTTTADSIYQYKLYCLY